MYTMFQDALPHIIGVFGNAQIFEKPAEVKRTGQRLGTIIAEHDITLAITSPLGFPLWTAEGAHKEHGEVILFSHAKNVTDHLDLQRLPLADIDIPIFTGMNKKDTRSIMLRSCQAVLFGPPSDEAIEEFSQALELGVPIGIVEGSWKTHPVFDEYLRDNPQYAELVVKDSNLITLVTALVQRMQRQ